MHEPWPDLPFHAWKPTFETLHRCCQIIGKVQLACTTLVNHWWNVAFLVDARGMHTQPMRWGDETFEVQLDLVDHRWIVRTSGGRSSSVPLYARPVAEFREEFFHTLGALGIHVEIDDRPTEIPGPVVPFREDREHASYDPDATSAWHRILLSSQRVFEDFRGRFVGKSSPVLFYWGSFDLAVTRFSGRPAPPLPDADSILREGHSHESCSAGLWPGTDALGGPLYYSYTVPAPPGYEAAPVEPDEARFDPDLGEFILPYDVVRRSARPRETLLRFLQSTYEAGADAAGWDRASLERQERRAPVEEAEAPSLH
ncbi:MAG TPA: DUF5996 family protein [Vulgatibacter sp.]|nr:DUF5996 family protein [Vulgatibacter sp.]